MTGRSLKQKRHASSLDLYREEVGIQHGAIKVGIADVYNLVAHLGFSSWIAPGQAGGG